MPAFADLFEESNEMLRDDHEAEDLVQKVFLTKKVTRKAIAGMKFIFLNFKVSMIVMFMPLKFQAIQWSRSIVKMIF